LRAAQAAAKAAKAAEQARALLEKELTRMAAQCQQVEVEKKEMLATLANDRVRQ